MQNISGFGAIVTVKASNTFPNGFNLTQFADDADPFDIPSLQVADKGMGVNGDLIVWSRANPISITINVIPGSPDDDNLKVLLEANRPGKGHKLAYDVIDIVSVYPVSGRVLKLRSGAITDGVPANGIASSGRQKTKSYQFTFENKED